MWVYRYTNSGPNKWTVGYHTINEGWTPIRDLISEDHARAECNYLNGGQPSGPTYFGEALTTLQQRVYQLEEDDKGD